MSSMVRQMCSHGHGEHVEVFGAFAYCKVLLSNGPAKLGNYSLRGRQSLALHGPTSTKAQCMSSMVRQMCSHGHGEHVEVFGAFAYCKVLLSNGPAKLGNFHYGEGRA